MSDLQSKSISKYIKKIQLIVPMSEPLSIIYFDGATVCHGVVRPTDPKSYVVSFPRPDDLINHDLAIQRGMTDLEKAHASLKDDVGQMRCVIGRSDYHPMHPVVVPGGPIAYDGHPVSAPSQGNSVVQVDESMVPR